MAQPVVKRSYTRTRAILTMAIGLLLALLVALGLVFYDLLQPKGLPDSGDVSNEVTGLTWIRSLYGFGPTPAEQLESPTSVAIAPNGDIFVTDPTRSRIMIFRSDGTFKRLFQTGDGHKAGEFMRPEALDVDAEGNLYVADSWLAKVVMYDQNLGFVREFPVENQARGVTAVGDRVYVLDLGKIVIFDKNGKKIESFSQRGPLPGQIDAYQGIAVDEGVIYVADTFNKRLQAFTDGGKGNWTVPGGQATRVGPASRAASGTDESASDTDPGHRWDLPQDLVFDGRGNLVVIDAFQFQMSVVDPKTGKSLRSYGEYGRFDGEFFYPSSIDYDPARDWFVVADTQNNRVQIVRIPESGASPAAAAWRAISSPYRYILVPAMLLILVLFVAGWFAWRALRRQGTEPSGEENV